MRLYELVDDLNVLKEMQPEELGQFILKILVDDGDRSSLLNPQNFTLDAVLKEYGDTELARRLILEGWAWLEREGFLIKKDQQGWYFVSRRGKDAIASDNWEAFVHKDRLPKKFLHHSIASKVWATYLRGDYETAVFQAFREVEIAVREAAGEPSSEIGVKLMRKAFKPDGGALADENLLPAENQALTELFSGSIGYYKNPSSHRLVDLGPDEASEAIILASHLLRIVESRKEQ